MLKYTKIIWYQGGLYDHQSASCVDSRAADRAVRRDEALAPTQDYRWNVEARRRTLSSTAGRNGNCVRGAICRAGHDEAGVYSRVLLLRRCDRHGAVARRIEGQL